jgi:ribose/xylose/arabinose/galactoside ABC-type transport system permease subunit
VVLLLIYGLGYLLIERHFFGKNVYAIGNNERAAYVAGIDVARTKIIAFALAGLFAAIGGLLEVGRLQSLTADMGEGDILMVFAAAVLGGTSLSGGKGRIIGILGAVLVLEVVDNLMNLRGVEPSIREIVFGLILLGGIYVASLQGRFSINSRA